MHDRYNVTLAMQSVPTTCCKGAITQVPISCHCQQSLYMIGYRVPVNITKSLYMIGYRVPVNITSPREKCNFWATVYQ